nr:hypothetical protein [Thiomonas sp.]
MHDAARALVRALEGAGDQRADYWTNRVAPYLHAIWPKTRDNISPAIAESLGRLCVAAQDAFPEALVLLRAWLQPPAQLTAEGLRQVINAGPDGHPAKQGGFLRGNKYAVVPCSASPLC